MHTWTRIVALGDSTTAGTPGWRSPLEAPPAGAGDETSQYAYWLMQAHPAWEVLNRGINGERSDEIRARFERDVLDADAAITIIIAGVNDVYQGRPATHVMEQLGWMYDAALQRGIRVVAGSILPYNTATPDQNARMHEINAWIRARTLATPGQMEFADTRSAASSPDSADRLLETPDDLHPSPSVYRRIAAPIASAIQRLR